MTRSANMVAALDPSDARLLDALQAQVPLVPQPFKQLGDGLGISEQDVLARIVKLKTEPRIIRQISAIFDSRALGYESCLVAAQYPEADIDSAADVISAHPGVSHNYRRSDRYNLWYTLAVPPDSRLGLDRTIEILHEQSGAVVTRKMPALKMYKIGVKFSLSGEDEAPQPARYRASAKTPPAPLSEIDKRIIRVLQQDLPIIPRPFDQWAAEAQVTLDELLHAAAQAQQLGLMRRFSAVLRHRQAGFSANAMGVWAVPEDQHDAFGHTAAAVPEVSHCYRRPTYADWPYSMYTMVHGRSPEQCEAVLRDISQRTGITRYKAVYSTHEYKKVRVPYFTDDARRWEEQALRQCDSRQLALSR